MSNISYDIFIDKSYEYKVEKLNDLNINIKIYDKIIGICYSPYFIINYIENGEIYNQAFKISSYQYGNAKNEEYIMIYKYDISRYIKFTEDEYLKYFSEHIINKRNLSLDIILNEK